MAQRIGRDRVGSQSFFQEAHRRLARFLLVICPLLDPCL